MTRDIYLDYNATTPTDPGVAAAMQPFFTSCWGNPSSSHRQGRQARAAVEEARAQGAALIGAAPEEFYFTAGGTVANNLALGGVAAAAPANRRHLIVSGIEHSSVWQYGRELVRRGWTVSEAPVDRDGRLCPAALERLIRPETMLISVMLANNETGTIQPVAEVAALAAANGVVMHTDAVQAAGKIPVDVAALGVDLLTLSGHKLYGPKGVGGLYVRRGLAWRSLLFGGGQEHGFQPGTENVPAVVGFGRAAALAAERGQADAVHLAALRGRLLTALRERFPALTVFSHPEHGLPNTLCFGFPGVLGTTLAARLDCRGLAVGTGSACSSAAGKPSRVLLAMGRLPEEALTAIRVSWGRLTTAAELDALVGELAAIFADSKNR